MILDSNRRCAVIEGSLSATIPILHLKELQELANNATTHSVQIKTPMLKIPAYLT